MDAGGRKVSAVGIRKFIEAVAMKANREGETKKTMRDWVGRYHGKIIQFETDPENFYLVVQDGRMEVRPGSNPSPDLTVRAPSRVITDVFTGRRRFGDAMKSWDLVLIGAGHEAFHLARLIMAVILAA